MAAPDPFLGSVAFQNQIVTAQHGQSQYQSTIFDDDVAPRSSVEQNASPSSPLDSRIEAVLKLVPAQAPQRIAAFLLRRPELVPILIDSAVKIREYWGVDTRYEMRLVTDPEEPDEDALSLVVDILSSDPDAYAILDRFDEEWWLERLPQTQGRLNFLV